MPAITDKIWFNKNDSDNVDQMVELNFPKNFIVDRIAGEILARVKQAEVNRPIIREYIRKYIERKK